MNLKLTSNALTVLEARYLRRDRSGQLIETPEEMFRRVAHAVAAAEAARGGSTAVARWAETYYELLSSLNFLPNSPTLMNAGTELGQLSACFVLPVGDSLVEIFDSLKVAALIQQSGGGTGFAFSRLRPRGDLVSSMGGAASGPVSFMRIFDSATENIRQGGKRRGANMGVLRADHPDIEEFVDAKRDGGSFRNFNLSVAASDEFMQAAESGGRFALRHPQTGQRVAWVDAAELFGRITHAAWETGDPGMIFIDTMNRANPTPAAGRFEATNPCGEVPLLPYEACNLGSVNLSRMLTLAADAGSGSSEAATSRTEPSIDWDRLAETTRLAVRFLDDVIEVGRWPAPQIEQAVRANRKIGLGVMGFAEMLIQMGIPYASPKAVSVAEELMRFISQHSLAASEQLAEERGVFANWPPSRHAAEGRRLRNATVNSIAPTGTIGIIAGTSASIEPLFALAYRRENVLGGRTLVELNSLLLRHARQQGFDSPQLLQIVQATGSLQGADVPPHVLELFRTALEIDPVDHLRIQSAFQSHVDNAVSKTINLPRSATTDDVAAIYQQAWQWGLKGVTIYRYGSQGQQVLQLGASQTPQEQEHFSRCDPFACRL